MIGIAWSFSSKFFIFYLFFLLYYLFIPYHFFLSLLTKHVKVLLRTDSLSLIHFIHNLFTLLYRYAAVIVYGMLCVQTTCWRIMFCYFLLSRIWDSLYMFSFIEIQTQYPTSMLPNPILIYISYGKRYISFRRMYVTFNRLLYRSIPNYA